MSFAEDIKKFEQKALLQTSNKLNSLAEELFTSPVVLSPDSPTRDGPYSQGTTKGNWYTAINSFDYSVNSLPDTSGASSFSRIKATLALNPFMGKDAQVTITNSTPWIRFVEYIGWPKNYPGNTTGWEWSGRSTPYAMVSTSVTTFKSKYT